VATVKTTGTIAGNIIAAIITVHIPTKSPKETR